MTVISYSTERTYVTIFDWLKGYIETANGHVGRLGFWGEPNVYGEVEIFYEIWQPCRQQGLMTEVLTGLLYELAEGYSKEVQFVKARVQWINVPSTRLIKKLGFWEEPMSRDCKDYMRFYRRSCIDAIPVPDTRNVLINDNNNQTREPALTGWFLD
jgi:RimJ/RimL family protein N-acetyltransferase